VITALNTGTRKREILNLRREKVEPMHGFILLDITKNGERREIPINETVENNPSVFTETPRYSLHLSRSENVKAMWGH
jgi:hypothetical protein